MPAATLTDAQGTFTHPAPPPPAPGRRVVLTAEAPAGRAALALRPDAPAPSPLVLRLAAAAKVRGRVQGRDGEAKKVVERARPASDAFYRAIAGYNAVAMLSAVLTS